MSVSNALGLPGLAWRRARLAMRLADEFNVNRLQFVVVVATSVIGGIAEAGVLALVAYIAASLSGSADGADISVAGISLDRFEVSELLWMAAFLALVRLALQLVGAYLPARMTTVVQDTVRERLIDAYLRASWVRQSSTREGEFEQILTQQANRAASSVTNVSVGAASLCVFITLVASAFSVHAVAAALAVVSAAVLFAVLRPLTEGTRREARQVSLLTGKLAQDTSELVRLAEEVHTFGVGRRWMQDMRGSIHDVSVHYFRTRVLMSVNAPIYQGCVIGLMIGGLAASHGTSSASVASLGAVVLMLIRALSYSQNVQTAYQQISEQIPSLELVRAQLRDLETERPSTDGELEVSTPVTLEFRDVSFEYAPGRPVLAGVNFQVRGGELVGVIGASGAGKSTLIQILTRLRDPTGGALLVNGRPVAEYSRASWFARLGVVPQEARVIEGTVAANIRFRRDDITDDAIVAAAKRAFIHDEIERLPLGYDTPIAQRVDALSGGQRQRLALARALAGAPALLVLDEPTSALDAPTEAAVTAALESLRGETTVLLVTHRLSTLRICDRVIVIEAGSVSAAGTVDELLESSDGFRRAFQSA